jgi:hypothetical protein
MATHDDNWIEPTVLGDAVPVLESFGGGLQRRPRRVFTPSAINTIRRLAAQGKSASQIAEVIGSTSASVRVKCCQLKIKLRGRHTRQISGQSLVIYLHDADYAALTRKAAEMRKSAAELSGELLKAVIRSAIYEAVLDDDR